MTTLAQIASASGFCRLGGDPDSRVGAVLLIHGLGESSSCFLPLLESNRFKDWSLVAPDLPGYGRTPPDRRMRRLEDYAKHVAEWIRAADSAPLVVAGHSMGGVIGQMLCEIEPSSIQIFLNVEGNLSLEDCAFSGRAAGYSKEAFRESGFNSLLEEVRSVGEGDAASAGYALSMALCDVDQFHADSLELVELSRSEALAPGLSRLSTPTLYVAGLRDRPPESRSLALLEKHHLAWVGFSRSGHWPFLDETDRFLQLLNDLLKGLSAGQTP